MPFSALRSFAAAVLEIVSRTIFDVPAGIDSFWRPRSIDTGLTTLRFLPLPTTFALPRWTSVAVAVSEQVVSHPIRTGRLRAVSRPALRRTLTVSCGPSGSGSVGYCNSGGAAGGGQRRAGQANGGVASVSVVTRLFSLSVTVSLPVQSTLTPVGWMNWPSPMPRLPIVEQALAGRAELLDAVVAAVGDPEVPGLVERHLRGRVELAELGAGATELVELGPAAVIDRDPVGGVGDVDLAAVGRHGDAARSALGRKDPK